MTVNFSLTLHSTSLHKTSISLQDRYKWCVYLPRLQTPVFPAEDKRRIRATHSQQGNTRGWGDITLQCTHHHWCLKFYYSAVPTPSVSVSADVNTVYAGRSVTLTCSITLPTVVDGRVAVSSTWTSPSGEVTNSSHTMIVEATPVSSQTHQSNLTISQLNLTEDSGAYTCTANISSLSEYVIGSSGTATRTLTILGM